MVNEKADFTEMNWVYLFVVFDGNFDCIVILFTAVYSCFVCFQKCCQLVELESDFVFSAV